MWTHESPRELVCQSEAKRKQAPQSQVNVCRRRKNRPLLIAQETQQCTEHATQIRGCVLVPRTQLIWILFLTRLTSVSRVSQVT